MQCMTVFWCLKKLAIYLRGDLLTSVRYGVTVTMALVEKAVCLTTNRLVVSWLVSHSYHDLCNICQRRSNSTFEFIYAQRSASLNQGCSLNIVEIVTQLELLIFIYLFIAWRNHIVMDNVNKKHNYWKSIEQWSLGEGGELMRSLDPENAI